MPSPTGWDCRTPRSWTSAACWAGSARASSWASADPGPLTALEPRFLEVEVVLHPAPDLVGDHAAVSQLAQLLPLGADHLAHQAAVGRGPMLVVHVVLLL